MMAIKRILLLLVHAHARKGVSNSDHLAFPLQVLEGRCSLWSLHILCHIALTEDSQ